MKVPTPMESAKAKLQKILEDRDADLAGPRRYSQGQWDFWERQIRNHMTFLAIGGYCQGPTKLRQYVRSQCE